jgi:hypothetical protein
MQLFPKFRLLISIFAIFKNKMSCMKATVRLVCVLCVIALIPFGNADAATCTTTAPGVWSCGTPVNGDNLIVNHAVTIGAAFTTSGTITINSGGSLTISGNLSLNGSGALTVNLGGTLTVSGVYNPDNTSTTVIFGIFNPSSIDMKGSSSFTVKSTGVVTTTGDLKQSAGTTLTVDAGGVATIGGKFDSNGTTTVNGILAVTGNFKLTGTICGTGTVTYGGTCNNGGGTACGVSTWCDQSHVITAGTLPISLVWFMAALRENTVELSWLTASELNNDFFTIERLGSGEKFEGVKTITGKGTTMLASQYQTVDEYPLPGTSYYRLKQTDFDGNFSYSKVRTIENNNPVSPFKVYPNPIVNNKFIVEMNGLPSNAEVPLSIINMQGVTVHQASYEASSSGILKVSVELNSVPSGVYMVVVNAATGLRKKIVVP